RRKKQSRKRHPRARVSGLVLILSGRLLLSPTRTNEKILFSLGFCWRSWRYLSMFEVREITGLHRQTVELWHRQPIANPYDSFLGLVCEQHKYNFLLWHEEDVARSPDVTDATIVQVKRAIDRYNQLRNDHIEKLDDFLLAELSRRGVATPKDARF